MNNEVKNYRGEVIGYRCFQCGGVFQSMWDCTCNSCRKKNDDNEALRAEIRRLSDALEKIKQ